MLPIQKGFLILAGALLWLCWLSLRRNGHQELRAKILEVVGAAARRELPLGPIIERMARTARGDARRALSRLATLLQDGTPIAQALDEALPPRTLPAHLLRTLQSVEGTSGLRHTLVSLSGQRGNGGLRIWDRLSLALAYPSLLAVMLAGLYVTTESLTGQDALAAGARQTADASGAVAQGAALALCGALAVALLGYLAGSRGALHAALDRLIALLPGSRRLAVESAAGRLLRTAAHLTGSRVPLGTLLRRAAPAAGHVDLERSALDAAEAADEGETPEEVWHRTGIPTHAAALIALTTSGDPRQLASRMHTAAAACERRVERSVDRLVSLIQPLAVVFFGSLIAIHFATVFARLEAARAAVGGMPW
ncbi:MAG: type II secretion system F family protein [Planctomycetes bacterium]|nr:type II secretion system F family protein [Planctomycetota bacterium]